MAGFRLSSHLQNNRANENLVKLTQGISNAILFTISQDPADAKV